MDTINNQQVLSGPLRTALWRAGKQCEALGINQYNLQLIITEMVGTPYASIHNVASKLGLNYQRLSNLIFFDHCKRILNIDSPVSKEPAFESIKLPFTPDENLSIVFREVFKDFNSSKQLNAVTTGLLTKTAIKLHRHDVSKLFELAGYDPESILLDLQNLTPDDEQGEINSDADADLSNYVALSTM